VTDGQRSGFCLSLPSYCNLSCGIFEQAWFWDVLGINSEFEVSSNVSVERYCVNGQSCASVGCQIYESKSTVLIEPAVSVLDAPFKQAHWASCTLLALSTKQRPCCMAYSPSLQSKQLHRSILEGVPSCCSDACCLRTKRKPSALQALPSRLQLDHNNAITKA
jgi:hypothetical protein